MKKRRSKGFVVDKDTGLLTGQRKLVKIGNSLYISLPREFIERHNLSEGDKLPIIVDDELRVVPVRR